MDQYSSKNEAAPFKLPEVQSESKEAGQVHEAGTNSVEENSMAKAIEQNTNANPLSSPLKPTAPPIKTIPPVFNDPTTMVQANPTPKKIAVTDSLPASDIDLIEKAWVVKAKAIVDQTKNDPYEQSDEIKKIREDYQSKRFNANVKLDKE